MFDRPTADILIALRRSERERVRDLDDALRAWGPTAPSTITRARKLAGVRAAIADGGRRMTRAEHDGSLA